MTSRYYVVVTPRVGPQYHTDVEHPTRDAAVDAANALAGDLRIVGLEVYSVLENTWIKVWERNLWEERKAAAA